MARFDEAWLRDYERRRAGQEQAEPPAKWPEKASQKPPGAVQQSGGQIHPDITITLSRPLLLPNVKKNMHWSKKSAAIHELSDEVSRAITNAPKSPLAFASVSILRYSLKRPDDDNLQESRKFLLDLLQPRSARHPYGLGIIAGDDPTHLQSNIQHVQAKNRAEQRTIVRIRDLGRIT